MTLESQGRNYEAQQAERRAKYDAMIEDARRTDPTGALAARLGKERDADTARFNAKHDESVRELTDEASVKHMRNSGDEYGAALAEIQNKYRKQANEAAGDPKKLAALKANEEEDIQSLQRRQSVSGRSAEERSFELIRQNFFASNPVRGSAAASPASLASPSGASNSISDRMKSSADADKKFEKATDQYSDNATKLGALLDVAMNWITTAQSGAVSLVTINDS
jgi:hypothetical protein